MSMLHQNLTKTIHINIVHDIAGYNENVKKKNQLI